MVSATGSAQDGFFQDFSSASDMDAWSTSSPGSYNMQHLSGVLEVKCTKTNWDGFGVAFPALDVSEQPFVSMDIRVTNDCAIQCWLVDQEGHRIPVSHYMAAADTFTRVTFNYTGMFATYRWDKVYTGDVDHHKITGIHFDINPGGPYTGILTIDNFAIGNHASVPIQTGGTGPFLDTVKITIQPEDIAFLDADPTDNEDVYGDFTEGNGHVHRDIELHYRGASNLLSFINAGRKERNWKVKVSSEDMYRGRREWNLNHCQAVQQEMAYHLFRQAGVPCISNRMVYLKVNDDPHGMYLEYEDPDNKPWLLETFGDEQGDLFKAAMDVPGEPSYFAELIYLGPNSSDYYYHYRKKTNHKSAPDDYTSIRDFIVRLNYTPNETFIDTLERCFAADSFLDYLVISNFISNWDGYPHRPKNYWLYQDRGEGGRFYFIPWDLDATLGLQTHDWNRMGVEAGLFYQFFETEWAGHNPAERADRPLVRRMMKFAEYRNAYIQKYRAFTASIFEKEKLFRELDSLGHRIRIGSGNYDYQLYNNSVTASKAFFHERLRYVNSVLDTLSFMDTVPVTDPVPPYPQLATAGHFLPEGLMVSGPYPNPAGAVTRLDMSTSLPMELQVNLYDQSGRLIRQLFHGKTEGIPVSFQVETGTLEPGVYILQARTHSAVINRKLIIAGN